MEQNKLMDVWRFMNSDLFHFTWKRLHPNPVFVRLVFFLMSELIYQSVTMAEMIPGFQTDHSIPRLVIDWEETTRGPGYWKFNNSLLQDQIFVEQLYKTLEIELAQPTKDPKQKWELIKLTIRNTALKYSARKHKAMKNKLAVLERKLKENENKYSQRTIFDNLETQNLRLKQEISEIMEYKTRGAILRCKASWTEMGERPKGYFLRMESARQNSRVLDAIIIEKGVKITYQTEVLREEMRFFKTLYTTRQDKLRPDPDSLHSLTLPTLTEEEKLMLDEPIVIEEVIEAVEAMKPNKCAGSDGISADVYKHYIHLLAPTMLALFQSCIKDNECIRT